VFVCAARQKKKKNQTALSENNEIFIWATTNVLKASRAKFIKRPINSPELAPCDLFL
jgi:hypothetical protein